MTIQAPAYQPYTPATSAYQPQTYSNTNYGVTPAADDGSTAFDADFSKISSIVSHTAGSGFAAYKLIANGSPITGVKGVLSTGLKGAGLAGLVSAGVSAVANGVGVATGKIEKADAISNVISDTITGSVGGLGAVAVGGIGHKILGSFMQGSPLMIATVALGAVGGTLAAQFTKNAIDNADAPGTEGGSVIGDLFNKGKEFFTGLFD